MSLFPKISFFITIWLFHLTQTAEEVDVGVQSELSNIIDDYVRSSSMGHTKTSHSTHQEVHEDEVKQISHDADHSNVVFDFVNHKNLIEEEVAVGDVAVPQEHKISGLKCVTFVDNSESKWGIRKRKNKISRVDTGTQGYDLGVEKGMIIETVDGNRYEDPKYYMASNNKLKGGRPCTICFSLTGKYEEETEAEQGFCLAILGLGNEVECAEFNNNKKDCLNYMKRPGATKGKCKWNSQTSEASVGDKKLIVVYDTHIPYRNIETEYNEMLSTQYVKKMNKLITPAESRTPHTLHDTKALIAGYKAAYAANGQRQTGDVAVGDASGMSQSLDEINNNYKNDADYKDPQLEEQLESYKKQFVGFDTDNSGALNIMELKMMMQNFDQAKTHRELKKMIDEVDRENRGEISYNDFLFMMLGKKNSVLKMILKFQRMSGGNNRLRSPKAGDVAVGDEDPMLVKYDTHYNKKSAVEDYMNSFSTKMLKINDVEVIPIIEQGLRVAPHIMDGQRKYWEGQGGQNGRKHEIRGAYISKKEKENLFAMEFSESEELSKSEESSDEEELPAKKKYKLVYDHAIDQESGYTTYQKLDSTKIYNDVMQPMHPVESRQTLPKFEYYAHAQGWISRKGRGGEHNNADVSVGIEEIEIDVADPMYNVESYYYAKNILISIMSICGFGITGYAIGKIWKNNSLKSSINTTNYQPFTELV